MDNCPFCKMTASLNPPEVEWSTSAEVQRIAAAIEKEWDDGTTVATDWLDERLAAGDDPDVREIVVAGLRPWNENARLELDKASTRLKVRYCAWREASLTKLEADEMAGTVETEYEND